MVKGSPSEALVVVGDGSGFGICGVGGSARDTCAVLNLMVLRCVLKTRTLRMNPTRTTIAHMHTWILDNRARILVHIT